VVKVAGQLGGHIVSIAIGLQIDNDEEREPANDDGLQPEEDEEDGDLPRPSLRDRLYEKKHPGVRTEVAHIPLRPRRLRLAQALHGQVPDDEVEGKQVEDVLREEG